MFSDDMHDSTNRLDGASGMFNARYTINNPMPEYVSSHDEDPHARSEVPESYDLRDRLRQKSSRQENSFGLPVSNSGPNPHVISEYGGHSKHLQDRTRELSRGDFQPLPKYRKFSPKEEPISIGQDMTAIFDQTLEESGLSSEQRIFKLVSRLKNRAVKYSLENRQVQLLVAKFLDEIIKEKNWTSMTVEKALLLCATVGDEVETKMEPCDFHQCGECAIGYPPGKYQCMCGDKFVHLSFLQSHKLIAHNVPPPISEIFYCDLCEIGFKNSVRDLAIHIRSRHMCPYEHIECPHQCGVLIVERSVSSVRDHVTRKHECGVCHDAIGADSSHHKRTFHNAPQELLQLGDAAAKISCTDVEKFLHPSRREQQPVPRDTPMSPPRQERGRVSSTRVKDEGAENADVPLPLIPIKPENVSTEVPEDVAHNRKKSKKVGIFVSCASCGLRTPFGAYKCRECSDCFVYRFQLFQHLREVHKNFAPFTFFCEMCGLLCSDLKSLSVHIQTRHSCSSKHLQCAYGCDKFFPSYEHLAFHNDECHEFFCNLCNKVVVVIDKSDHIKNCCRNGQNAICDQNVEENLTAKCEQCSFLCPQGIGFTCEFCLKDPNSPALHEFVDEIELMHHSLLHHKDKSHAARTMTISCVLCPSSEDDSFDVFSFIHHRKAVHSICEIHVRCPNKPCDKIMSIKGPATADHVNTVCEYKKDLDVWEQVDLPKPSWKACRQCPYVGFVCAISYCDLCPGEVPFISNTERFLHLLKSHGYGGNRSMTCALCRLKFANLHEFEVHRSNHHKFCRHHFLCLGSEECDFLFGSPGQADHHAKNDNFCAIQLPYGRKNRSKFCHSCAGIFKIHSITVCYFCDFRPTFISTEDFLCHLWQLHGRRVAGFFNCTECEEQFEDPKLLKDHLTTTHGRCNMHKFCRNSIECHTVFSSNDRGSDHPCNYEPNLPLDGNPEPMPSGPDVSQLPFRPALPSSSKFPVPTPFPPPLLPPFIPEAAPVLDYNLKVTAKDLPKAESTQVRASRNEVAPMASDELKRHSSDREKLAERRQKSPERRPSSPERNPSSPGKKSAKNRLGNKGKVPERNQRIIFLRNDEISRKNSDVETGTALVKTDEKKVIEGVVTTAENDENYRKLAAMADQVAFCRYCNYASDIIVKVHKEMRCKFCLQMFHQKFELEYHLATVHGEGSGDLQLYSGCDACTLDEKYGNVPTEVFIQGTAEDLVKHRFQVHGIKIHWICGRDDCTILFDVGNTRQFEEHQKHKCSMLPCASVFAIKKIPLPCKSPNGRIAVALKDLLRVCVIFTCVDCNGDFSVYGTEMKALFQRCRACFTPPFFSPNERNYHFVTKHAINKGKDVPFLCVDCPPGSSKMDIVTLMKHRNEYHGFCLQHFICPMKGCFFMTSKPNRFYWEHRRHCQGGQKPLRLPEKTLFVLKRFPAPLQLDEFVPEDPWGPLHEFEYPPPGELERMDATSCEIPPDARFSADQINVSGDAMIQTHDDNRAGTSEMKNEPCWDDMMTNMLQYTDELMQ